MIASASISHTTERTLLYIISFFILINYTALAIVKQQVAQPAFWVHPMVWLICTFAGHHWLNRHLPQRDKLIYPLVMLLSGWGLILIERLQPGFADRQTVWLVGSTALMLGVAVFPQPLRWLRVYRYTLLLIGLILLVATIVLGSNPSGNASAPQLWLALLPSLGKIGPLYFQPSEALKIILVAFLASYMAEQQPALRAEELSGQPRRFMLSARIAGPILLMWGISIIMLVWQRDLGTAILFFIVFLLMLYTATGSALILSSGGALILIAGLAAYYLFSVVQLRVDIWLNPWPEADGRAYQIVQSLMAFASGGILGQGIGQGLPVYIPVVHSDFIFAALAEEWGLLGVITVIAAIALLVLRGMRIAVQQESNPFRALFAIGLTMLIAIQSLLIMGGVLKIIPLTGVTLPFMSYGGSSMIISFIMIGLLLRLSSMES